MKLVAFFIIAASMFCFVAQAGEISTDKQVVETACAQDTKTADCLNKKVGSGLMRCLRAYKTANPSYKLSNECKRALVNLRLDFKASANTH